MARNTALQQLAQIALTVARDLGIGDALRRSTQSMPHVRRWLAIRRVNALMRAGDTARLLDESELLVPEQELKRVFRRAWRLLAEMGQGYEPGDYLEFGVYVGTSLSYMHDVLEEEGLDQVRLFGFDSFQGLPKDTHEDETSRIMSWRAGDMNAPYDLCRANLTQRGVNWQRTKLVKGFFEDTLTPELARQLGIRKAGVIMVDSNLYSSAKAALDFCAPLIGDHTVILFDDWCPDTLGAARTGERRAFEEFLAAHTDFVAEELESYLPENAKVFVVSRASRVQRAPAPRA